MLSSREPEPHNAINVLSHSLWLEFHDLPLTLPCVGMTPSCPKHTETP